MKTLIYLAAVLVCLSFVGCKPKETTLSGQIFIVTRGSENIKLGLVEVQIIKKNEAVKFLEKIQTKIDFEINSQTNECQKAKADFIAAQDAVETFNQNTNFQNLKTRYESLVEKLNDDRSKGNSLNRALDAAQSEFDDAKHNMNSATGGLRQFYREIAEQKNRILLNINRAKMDWISETSDTEAMDKEASEILAKLEKIKPLEEKQKVALQNFQACSSKIEKFLHPRTDVYFTDFRPEIKYKTLTDADGKFSISYPRDTGLTIFAQAEREVGEKREKFFWLINAPSSVENRQILLSNNNLVFSDPDDYFKIKPQPEMQPQPTP